MKPLLLAVILFSSSFSMAAPGDTLGVSFGTTPSFAPNNQVSIIPYQNGYCYGVNFDNTNNFIGIAQGYINEDPAMVSGVVSFIARKEKGANNVPNTKITFNLYAMTATGASQIVVSPPAINPVEGPGGQILASKDLFFDEIDTNLLTYNVVVFDAPVSVTGNIAVAVDFAEMKAAGDVIGFLSDNVGNANGINYAYHRALIGSVPAWYTSNSVFQGALDNNIAIFPVLATDEPSGLKENTTYRGITTNVYPNPASDLLTVDFSGMASGAATLSMLNAQGKVVKVIQQGFAEGQKQQIQIGVSDVPAGSYILMIEDASGKRFARQVLIGN